MPRCSKEEEEMPKGSKVDDIYQALLKEGKSKEQAAKISQAKSGEALATGKPPKHENSDSLEIGQQIKAARKKADDIYKEMQKSPEAYARLKGSHEKAKKEQERLIDLGFKSKNCSVEFQNGRDRAIQEIQNKAEKIGMRVENHWYNYSRIGRYQILQGAGVNGGEWMAKGRGESKKFKTKEDAEEHARLSDPNAE
jgi:hypothetical protein